MKDELKIQQRVDVLRIIEKALEKYDVNFREVLRILPLDAKYIILKDLAKHLKFKLIPWVR